MKIKNPILKMSALPVAIVLAMGISGVAQAETVDACHARATSVTAGTTSATNYYDGMEYNDFGTLWTYTVTDLGSGSCQITGFRNGVEGDSVYGSTTTMELDTGTGNGDASEGEVVSYDDADGNSVTLNENEGAGTTITNVAPGELSATSMDAVNGSQLFETNEAVAANTADIATNADAIADNTTLAQQGVDDAAAAQTTADEALALGQNSIQYDDDGGASATLNENGGTGTTLHNVAVGELAEGSMDAINGGQLYTTNQAVAANTTLAQQGVDDAAAAQTTADEALAAATAVADNGAQYDDETGTTLSLNDNDGAGTELSNVADGEVAENSQDAVNGSQLYETNQSVEEALAAANSALEQAGAAQLASENGAQYDDETGTSMSLNNNDGAGTSLHNVADGELFDGSMDAVNAGQLYETNQAVGANTSAIGVLRDDVDNNSGQITTLQEDVAGNTNAIGVLRDDVDNNSGQITTLQEDVAGNTNAIGVLRDNVMDNAANISRNADAIETNAADIADNRELAIGAQQTADTALELGLNSAQYSADGNLELRTDENGNPVSRITNVADGVLGTDAANVNQVNAAMSHAMHEGQIWTTEHVRDREQVIRQDMVNYTNQAAAHTLREANEFAATAVAAMASVPVVRLDAGKQHGFAVGTAYIENELALGGAYTRKFAHANSSGQLDVGMGISENGVTGVKGGYSWSW